MTRLFRLGERVEVTGVLGQYAFMNDMIVTIVGTYKLRDMHSLGTNKAYLVETAGGIRLAMSPSGLQAPKPFRGTMDNVVDWEDCAWRPREEAA